MIQIPTQLTQELLRRSNSGEGPAALVEWLATKGVTITKKGLRSAVADIRKRAALRGPERDNAQEDRIKEIVKPTVDSALAELQDVCRRAKEYEELAAGAGDYVTALRALDSQRAALAVTLRVLEPEQPLVLSRPYGVIALPPLAPLPTEDESDPALSEEPPILGEDKYLGELKGTPVSAAEAKTTLHQVGAAYERILGKGKLPSRFE